MRGFLVGETMLAKFLDLILVGDVYSRTMNWVLLVLWALVMALALFRPKVMGRFFVALSGLCLGFRVFCLLYLVGR
jgi:hypothetical protein